MHCTNNFCIIKDTLENTRKKLEEAVTSNLSNLIYKDTLKLSQSLDDLLVRCVKCKTTKGIIDILDINNIAGKHSMFFYYSKEHLLVCLAQYIKQGIENNEFCPIFLQPDWYKSLFSYLNQINLPCRNIQHYPVNEMLESFISGGSNALKKKVLNLAEWAHSEGFSGIRMVGQCAYAIKLSSKSDFLRFEKAINDAFNGTIIAGLCVYNFYDYINTQTYIEDDVLCNSFDTHTNIHFQFSYSTR